MAHLLELKGVTQKYGRGDRRFTAVDNVSLTIDEGEFVALLGPSGCGKSTLLRIITGLNQPAEGQVLYRGQPLRGVNPYATIVFQTFALFPWLTVQQNVEVALKARGVPPNLRTVRAIDLLDMVGLDGFETAFPARTFRRDAPEGGLCAGNGGGARIVVPGRGVLGARCSQRRIAAR